MSPSLAAPSVVQREQQIALQEEGWAEEAQELLRPAREEGSQRRTAVPPWIGRVAGMTLLLAFGCALATVLSGRAGPRLGGTGGPERAAAGGSVELYGGGPDVTAQVAAVRERHPGWDPYYWDQLVDGKNVSDPSMQSNATKKCRSNEEKFGGLCYKTCAILTSNEYPIRTTAFTCCKSHPCHPFNMKKDMGFCSGFSVGGGEGNNCPHPPGQCYDDEENLLGRCFKKCSILTNGAMPHRLTANACCKMKLSYKCIFPSNIRVRKSFDVGGGGANAALTAQSHMPIAT